MDLSPIAGYSADTTNNPDLLGIDPDVTALAQIIAARDVRPPLSIGLFGSQASGKSFFLRKLHERVTQIASASRQTTSASAYCSQVIQVDYNAWHYMGANQWLALVERIFIELDRRYSQAPGDKKIVPVSSAHEILRDLQSKIARAVCFGQSRRDEIFIDNVTPNEFPHPIYGRHKGDAAPNRLLKNSTQEPRAGKIWSAAA